MNKKCRYHAVIHLLIAFFNSSLSAQFPDLIQHSNGVKLNVRIIKLTPQYIDYAYPVERQRGEIQRTISWDEVLYIEVKPSDSIQKLLNSSNLECLPHLEQLWEIHREQIRYPKHFSSDIALTLSKLYQDSSSNKLSSLLDIIKNHSWNQRHQSWAYQQELYHDIQKLTEDDLNSYQISHIHLKAIESKEISQVYYQLAQQSAIHLKRFTQENPRWNYDVWAQPIYYQKLQQLIKFITQSILLAPLGSEQLRNLIQWSSPFIRDYETSLNTTGLSTFLKTIQPDLIWEELNPPMHSKETEIKALSNSASPNHHFPPESVQRRQRYE